MKNKLLILLLALILTAALTACESIQDGAAQAIEMYITAMVEKDTDVLINDSCAAWEEGAQTDSRALDGVEAYLEDLACASSGTDGDYTLVRCEGNIIATYAGEDQPLPLDARQYLAIEEGGEWRMCGYK